MSQTSPTTDFLDNTPHPSFELCSSTPIASLNINAYLYRHKITGAEHLHLAADSDENAFLVALRTVPTDSTGVAHILEHLALCGSEKFPVRDPFFMMLRRSLNTFMNAMTSSDWTAYPFATCNRKDFDNLLSVYLDAVFFSRLDKLDFAQEGHRLEFEEAGNTDSNLVYKGVVFNEMKGAMSSISSTLWQTLSYHLFPSSTYHYNSGGEPADIPSLDHDDLVAFYKTHYHPGNAMFMTFGNIPAGTQQKAIEEQALVRFQAPSKTISVSAETRLQAPVHAVEHYAFDEEDSTNKTHIVMGWLLGEASNLTDALEAQLLSGVLLDNSASPLQKALETTDIGSAPSPLCGSDDSSRELVFVCGIEGADANATSEFEKLVITTLEEIVATGVPQADIESVLHQLELHQREIGGDSYPYGLQLLMQGLGAFVHNGDIVETLSIEVALEQLRDKISNRDYIPNLVNNLLLNNTHRVTLTMHPDSELGAKKDQQEADKLAAIKAGLNDDQKQAIVTQATALETRQNQEDDASILPKVGIEDVPPHIIDAIPNPNDSNSPKTTSYSAGTNGLCYQQVVFKLPMLSTAELALLPHYCHFITELGLGADDYLAVQKRQASIVGSINAFSNMRSQLDNNQQVDAFFTLSAKALNRNIAAMAALMHDTLTTVRFDELPRLRELIAQARARREQSVVGSGHAMAMLAASGDYSPLAQYSNTTGGLLGLQALRALDDSLNDESTLAVFGQDLNALHQKITNATIELLNIADEDSISDSEQVLADTWSDWTNTDPQALLQFDAPTQTGNQIWQANTQVNFCALAFPTVGVKHIDAAPLTVLGVFLRNGFLHRAIREQGGAYGSGAGQESNYGVFRFFSYRDPRLEGTIKDFYAALTWLSETKHDSQNLEEAILGVIGSLDKTSSPAGKAKQHFYNNLFGRKLEQRQQFRQQVLAVTVDDMKRVADKYLINREHCMAVVSNEANTANLTDFIATTTAKVLSL
jgi:Zn-dependent M16 (insulinase) family peptidase